MTIHNNSEAKTMSWMHPISNPDSAIRLSVALAAGIDKFVITQMGRPFARGPYTVLYPSTCIALRAVLSVGGTS